ncbi:MAG TPA: PAS domain-containing protein [Acetobacteraceae bacterium]|nr:PAS domain-containing protein [Acetobacteraceae bacterium]
MPGAALPPFPIDPRAILESMGDAFYALDAEWRFVYANRRALAFWKLPAQAVIGRVIWERLPQLVGTRNEQVLRRARAEQQTIAFEAPSPTTGIWVAVTVGPAGDGVAAYWRDITERLRAEQALRASEEHLRLAQEAGGIGTWEWDLASGGMQWSAQMFRVLGLQPTSDTDLQPALLTAVHPDDRAHAAAQLGAFRHRAGPLRMEVRVVWPNGATRWIVFLGRVVADAAGKPVRMLGIAIDGTHRRTGEEAVRADAERLKLAMQAGGLATWECNLISRVRHWSPEAAAMHGFPPQTTEMRDDEWTRIIHPDDRDEVRARFTAAVAGTGDYAAEYRILRPDGVRWSSVQGSVLRDDTGRPTRVVGVVHDITGRKVAEARLRSLNTELEVRVRQEMAEREAAQARAAHAERMQALGQLAGGIAHDFNNVLQAVTGGAALIDRRPGDAESVRRFARIVVDAATRGSSITRRLLAFAHRSDLRAEPVEVGPLFDGLREILVHTLGVGIAVRVRVESTLPPLFADRGQLETVLVNLATNARDAMPAGGTLRLLASRAAVPAGLPHPLGLAAGGYVALIVSDTGLGMDPATLARASEPFFTTKPRGEGTGLGLAMARGFAEQSGGALRIDSVLGRGTRVTLWLPQAVEPVAAATVGEEAGIERDARAIRVLVVDDDALVRETLTAQLEAAGLVVLAAEGGDAALVQLDAGVAVDCLVADLSMPGIDGVELIRQAQRRQPRLAAILLTGFAGAGTALAVSGAVSGSFSLLRKPVQGGQLADRISMLLEAEAARG